jgi:methylenetetrahydrofolate reductase (NADPH)
LKVITNKSQLTNIPKNFYITIPEELANEISEAKPEHVTDVGARWSAKQVSELFNKGIPAVHFYIMQSVKPIKKMFEYLKM